MWRGISRPNGIYVRWLDGERPWAPGVWEISWQTSTDPDIAGGWGSFLWDWGVSPAISATEAISAVLDGVMMDNGILPKRKDEATGWEEGADQLITDTREVLFQFWHAGWEPVTHAWTGDEAVWVERFGPSRRMSRPSLFLTVHNTLTETASFTLTVDAEATGMASPAGVTVTELVSGDQMPFEIKDGRILVRASVAGLDTQVLRLQSPARRIHLPLVMKKH
jgi:hypothetical protein